MISTQFYAGHVRQCHRTNNVRKPKDLLYKVHIFLFQQKSIKYICKYVNKGSVLATIGIQNSYDEVLQFQNGRYISTSEATWRIFSFPIHERFPPIIHLDVHLENGQRVYFREDHLHERIENPRNTTCLLYTSVLYYLYVMFIQFL